MNPFCCMVPKPGEIRLLKLMIVGDEDVGKSSLFSSYCKNTFPAEEKSTIYDYNSDSIERNRGKSYMLRVFDASAREEADPLRILEYRDTNAFILCFNVMAPGSLEGARVKWIPELRHSCPNTPILLIGTQVDSRTDAEAVRILALANQKPVTKEQGQELATELNLAKYLECSAMTRKGVVKVFRNATAFGATNLDQHEQELA